MGNPQRKYDKYIGEIEIPEMSGGLERKIGRRIKHLERRKLILQALTFGAILVGSSTVLVYAYLNLMAAFLQSGFLDVASLFFSDFSMAMANFQDFFFSIIESFPVFSAAFVVAGAIAVVWSAAHFIEDIAEIRDFRKYGVAG
jgi:hypothetical protein